MVKAVKTPRLSAREKTAVAVCGLFIFGMAAYWGAVEPLRKRRAETAKSIERLEGELRQVRLLAIESARLKKPEIFLKSKTGSRLAEYISSSLAESGIKGFEVAPGSNEHSVNVSLESADYARVMEWLETIRLTAGVVPASVRMESTGDANNIAAEMILAWGER